MHSAWRVTGLVRIYSWAELGAQRVPGISRVSSKVPSSLWCLQEQGERSNSQAIKKVWSCVLPECSQVSQLLAWILLYKSINTASKSAEFIMYLKVWKHWHEKYTKYFLKIADLQVHNASRCDALWACRSAIFKYFVFLLLVLECMLMPTLSYFYSSTFWIQDF